MKILILLLCVLVSAAAQTPATPAPKKPFTGFGPSALDRKGGPMPPRSAPGTTSPTLSPGLAAKPAATMTSSSVSGGMTLFKGWDARIGQGVGGQTGKSDDLRWLLARYGSSAANLSAQPQVTVYAGPILDGAPTSVTRVTYLMPLDQAESALFTRRPLPSRANAVAPGFPEGLTLNTYDVRAGIYNRVCIITDSAKPQPQVVALQLKAENMHWIPASPPWVKLERDWHTYDYVNTKNRGQGSAIIDTRIYDRRKNAGHIIVKSSGANRWFPPKIIGDIVEKPARGAINETSTLYLPQPMIDLVLFCLSH